VALRLSIIGINTLLSTINPQPSTNAAPFHRAGGLGKMYQVFGDRMDTLISELNEALAA
jgi:hypothetical protein